MDGSGLNNWLIGGGLFAIASFTGGIFWKVGKIKEEVDIKVGRNYARLDEVKREIAAETVPQRICDLLHAQTQKDMGEIKESVKCIPKVKANLDLLLQKNGINTED